MTLLTIVTTVFLERVMGFGKSTEGIEASNYAYYQSVWLIEEQLMDPLVTKKTPWNITSSGTALNPYHGTGRILTVSTGAAVVPVSGKGNSPFSSDYNLISLGEPVQLVIPQNIDWNNVRFTFRVPQIGGAGTGVDASMNSSWVVLWTFWYSGASLFASGETEIFQWSDINIDDFDQFYTFYWITNSGSSMTINSFYNDNTNNYLGLNGTKCANYACTLKLSMIRQVRTSDGRSLPFLEYKVEFPSWTSVPSQFMTLTSQAKAYGFLRTREVKIPQITTNTALDFAILQ